MQRDAFCTWLFARSLRRCAASETTNVIWEMEAICWHQSLAAGIAVNRDINPAPVVMGGGYEGSFITQIGAIHWCVTNQLVCWEKLSSAWHKTSNALNLDSFYTFHCFLSSSCLSYIRSWCLWLVSGCVTISPYCFLEIVIYMYMRFQTWSMHLYCSKDTLYF